ncbi:reverse transcriptase family protein [Flavobacterium sp. MFBS3-15]|uniref:reverse transcriptase family protein n=1 Tax=Flavobacterium sp. MFBS3-15 TaxID=2989816 RepID=UPI002235CEE5|nr:reverse transcriptase family protein [Flavobacterium sp. MFBS3-15]MCW4468503.1 reverse transcriptase family protein [Flavobacterium sp. MFBS3-15]
MNSSDYKASELKRIGAIVKFSRERLSYLIENPDEHYRERTEEKKDKKGDYKRYLDGTIKTRTISPSKGDLKFVQHKIKNRILSKYVLPKNIHGGVKRRSNITNAKVHQGKKFVFMTDLQNFYPSINATMVYDALISLGETPYFASHISKLTTWKNQVPQGAPTSTHISNIVFLKTDRILIDFCNKRGITYTRYIDDLTFSSPKNFQEDISEILTIIQNGGFLISRRKTVYGGKIKLITGIEVYHNKIDVPQKIKDLARTEVDLPVKPYTDYCNRVWATNNKIYR